MGDRPDESTSGVPAPGEGTARPGDRPERWPVRATTRVYDGPGPFAMRSDTVTAPADPAVTFDRVVVEHPGAVVVLAVDDRERAFVLEQYRHPVARRLVELPAGLLDEPGEEPVAAAARELREEALLLARSWTHLLSSYSSPGLSEERVEIFLARGLTAAPDRGGFVPAHEEADMTSAWLPVGELLAGFLEGRVLDGPLGQAVMAYALGVGETDARGSRVRG